ncbi:MAG: UDP-3-O-[3-hydroxymyristoyl] N-acetylglucosamine deacetylase [Elusimicrobia bacterium]|nr:UDP-3-O-[3-hydroxymyristoyl] N-acetylglucosamine deacetylase [Elusimicrobiota bacterium]
MNFSENSENPLSLSNAGRTTIKKTASLNGTGLHKGGKSEITFVPAEEPSGIRFVKTDVFPRQAIEAGLKNVIDTARGTSLGIGKHAIYTVEHVLSACMGLGIDDLDVEIRGDEIPAMDGSALPFSLALLGAGMKFKQNQPKKILNLSGKFEISIEKAKYKVKPSGSLQFSVTYEHPHKLIKKQTAEICLEKDDYVKEIAPARTFGFKSEIEELRKHGLALGGSLENAVVIDENCFLTSPGGLRFENEFARHKLLDLLGDLKLTGLSLRNLSVEASYTSHRTNVNFAKLLLERTGK